MASPLTFDEISYRGVVMPNVAFNRLAAIVTESFTTAFARSAIIAARDSRTLNSFLLESFRRFTIPTVNLEEDILQFWEDAARTRIGADSEYMISFFMEVNSVFNVLSSEIKRSEILDLVCLLFPKMEKAEPTSGIARSEAVLELNELKEAYNISQLCIEYKPPAQIRTTIETYPWIIPWLVLSHMDYNLTTYLTTYIVRLVVPEKNPNDPGNQEA